MGLFNLFTRKKNIENENGLNTSYFCGYKRYEHYKKNGKIHGKWYEFYENGVIKSEVDYFEGEQGKCVEYFKSGRKWKETYSEEANRKGITTKIFYYRNGVKSREEQLKNYKIYGDIIEYNKDGSLKFKYNDGTYLFFNSEGQKAFSISNEQDKEGRDLFCSPIGTWHNFRSDGTLQYELEFDKKNSKKKLVKKTIYTKSGDIFSTTKLTYECNHDSYYLYFNRYTYQRLSARKVIIIPGLQGPGSFPDTHVENKPIKSIEDIIKLTPI
jgi:antitoxin component YwqK of YwqJK toxin-antitoxin module